MPYKVFIDGDSGTTGLGIRNELSRRPDIELKSLPDEARKDPKAKLALMAEVDLMILCLPDDAAKDAAAIALDLGERAPKILDASTAHRISPGWIYGFPELDKTQADLIRRARRVANPGCYATGAIALLHPLTAIGLIPGDFHLSIHAVSGYTGGGKAMIALYEQNISPAFEAYGLNFDHKHIPEIMAYGGLTKRPVFMPSVGNFAQGMLVFVPVFLDELPTKPEAADLRQALASHYGESGFVRILPPEESGRLEPQSLNGTNFLEVRVFANMQDRQVILAAKLDNLGKGASGAALQNIELMLGL